MRSLANLTRICSQRTAFFPKIRIPMGLTVPRRLFSLELSEEEKQLGDFSNFDMSPSTINTLRKNGINHLFPIQAHAYEAIYRGKDFLGKDQTGSGKTLAFLLPLIDRLRRNNAFGVDRDPKVLIMAPTRELAMQIEAEALKLRVTPQEFRVLSCVGGMNRTLQLRQIKSGVDIVVGTPGRIWDFLEAQELSLGKIDALILDEVDTMLDMGFRVAINQIVDKMAQHIEESSRNPQDTQFIMFSATIPPVIKGMVDNFMKEDRVAVDMTGSRVKQIPKTITHYIHESQNKNELFQNSVNIITKLQAAQKSVLVFMKTKVEVQDYYDELSKRFNCGMLSSDVAQVQRSYWLKSFKEKQTRVLLSTNVASRGIDVPGIDVVVQIGLDRDSNEFVHRSGRTGRAGKSGISLLFSSPEDEEMLAKIHSSLGVKFKLFDGSAFHEEVEELAAKAPPQEVKRPLMFNFTRNMDRNRRFGDRNFRDSDRGSFRSSSWNNDDATGMGRYSRPQNPNNSWNNAPQKSADPAPANCLLLQFPADFKNIGAVTTQLAENNIFPSLMKNIPSGSQEVTWKLCFDTDEQLESAREALENSNSSCRPLKVQKSSS